MLLHCEVGHALKDGGFGGNVVDFEGSAWTPLQRQVELQQHLGVKSASNITIIILSWDIFSETAGF